MQLEGVRVFIIGSHFSSRWSWDGFKIWMLLYMLRFQCSAEFTNLASSLYCQPDTWGRLQSILVQYIDLGELLKGQLENRNCNLKRVNLLQILIPQQSSKEVSVQQFTKTLPGQSSKLQLFFSSCFFFSVDFAAFTSCGFTLLWFRHFAGGALDYFLKGKWSMRRRCQIRRLIGRTWSPAGLINKISPFWMVLVKNYWRSCCCGKKRGVFLGVES